MNIIRRIFFKLFDKNGILMFQAHPLRGYCVLGDLKYMHGLEVYNGNHENYNEKCLALAKENNLLCVSGSDYHGGGENAVSGGILIPQNINDEIQLAGYIKNNKLKLIKKGIITDES